MASGNFVAYYRVSTKKQGDSGLGLEAQKEAVARHLNGGDWKLVAEFTEVESGTRKGNNRPKLKEALTACKLYGATLIIAKLDRLYRNVFMVSSLQESGVNFLCCDNPHANRSMVQMMAVFAEMEAERISQRTADALAAKKQRGEPTGASCWKSRTGILSPENQIVGRSIAATRIKEKSDVFAARVMVRIDELRAENPTISLRGIAAGLEGIPTMRGGKWSATTVKKILER
jgi:DNA invertase Pin-like site-specific DNA recombinase